MTKGALSEEERKEVVKYRLYYAAYYAVSALLIAYGISAKAHSGIIL